MITEKYQILPYSTIQYNRGQKNWTISNLQTGEKLFIDIDVVKKIEELKYGGFISEETMQKKLLRYIQSGMLVQENKAWEVPQFKNVEVEINTNCNRRCIFCPVYNDPKPAEYMDMQLFEEVLEKVGHFPSIEYISLNHYNEPTLDISFEKRIQKITQTKLKLVLHTNASTLHYSKIDLLNESGILHKLYVNLPTVDEEEFIRMTGTKLYKNTIDNLNYAIEKGLPVELSIQGTDKELDHSLPKIIAMYGKKLNNTIEAWGTGDRAGLLTNQYAQNIYVQDEMLPGGCPHILNSLNIGVDGSIHICANDYYRKYIYGNIRDGEIKEIFETERAQELLKQVFTGMKAEEDFICRRCSIMKLSKVNKMFLEHHISRM